MLNQSIFSAKHTKMTIKTGQNPPIKQEVKHTVSSHFARAQLANAKRLGLDEEQLLQTSQLTRSLLSEEDARISPQQLADLYQAVWRTSNDEYMGLTKTPSRFGVFSLICEYMLVAETLGEGLKRAAHFYRLVSDDVRLILEEEDDLVWLTVSLEQPELDINNQLVELLLLIWHRFPSWLVAEVIPLQKIHFCYSAPKHSKEYRLLYPGPCYFNQPSNSLVWPKEVLEWPIRRNQSQLKAFLKEIPLPWFKKQRYLENTTDQVMRLLEDAPEERLINIEDVAESLQMTSRTLRRRLTAEGSSFQNLKDEVNRDRAIFWLSQDITVADISRKCGYTEPGAFIRAFKQWTDMSPGDYRRRLLSGK